MAMRTNEHSRDASAYRATERNLAPEPSATDAVERVIEAGQRLVTERIELAKLDVQDAISGQISRGVMIVVPGALAFGGWWILMAAVIAVLNTYLVLPASLAIVGGAHVLLGGGVAAVAMKRGVATATPRTNGRDHTDGEPR